jgi:predicted glutamine amidotransferase
MCVIAIKTPQARFDIDLLRNCFLNNPDGAGLAYRIGNVIVVRKGFMTLQELLQYIRRHRQIEKTEVVLHFRVATVGAVTPELCHPFPVENCLVTSITTKQAVVFHNGHIPELEWRAHLEAISDSALLVSQYLAPLASMLDNPDFHRLLQISFPTSKFVIMTPRKTHMIGTFMKTSNHPGWFFSNTSFLPLCRYSMRLNK